jgi:hypothetical protein
MAKKHKFITLFEKINELAEGVQCPWKIETTKQSGQGKSLHEQFSSWNYFKNTKYVGDSKNRHLGTESNNEFAFSTYSKALSYSCRCRSRPAQTVVTSLLQLEEDLG